MPVNTQKSSRFLILGKLQASSSPLKTEDDPTNRPTAVANSVMPGQPRDPWLDPPTVRVPEESIGWSDPLASQAAAGAHWAAPAWTGEAWIGEAWIGEAGVASAWVVQAWVVQAGIGLGSAPILWTSQRHPTRLPGPQRLHRQPYAMLRRRQRPGARSVAAAAPVAGVAATPPTDAE